MDLSLIELELIKGQPETGADGILGTGCERHRWCSQYIEDLIRTNATYSMLFEQFSHIGFAKAVGARRQSSRTQVLDKSFFQIEKLRMVAPQQLANPVDQSYPVGGQMLYGPAQFPQLNMGCRGGSR